MFLVEIIVQFFTSNCDIVTINVSTVKLYEATNNMWMWRLISTLIVIILEIPCFYLINIIQLITKGKDRTKIMG